MDYCPTTVLTDENPPKSVFPSLTRMEPPSDKRDFFSPKYRIFAHLNCDFLFWVFGHIGLSSLDTFSNKKKITYRSIYAIHKEVWLCSPQKSSVKAKCLFKSSHERKRRFWKKMFHGVLRIQPKHERDPSHREINGFMITCKTCCCSTATQNSTERLLLLTTNIKIHNELNTR